MLLSPEKRRYPRDENVENKTAGGTEDLLCSGAYRGRELPPRG